MYKMEYKIVKEKIIVFIKLLVIFFIIGIGSDYLFKSGGVDFLKSFSIALRMSLGIHM